MHVDDDYGYACLAHESLLEAGHRPWTAVAVQVDTRAHEAVQLAGAIKHEVGTAAALLPIRFLSLSYPL